MEKRGLVLVVGGSGTGKSTTLAAMIDYRNSNSPGHIITVEDPIEFIHLHKRSLVTQREVGMDTNSFADALKNTSRQAPDVILIGEVRDVETMESAITFAETGHLCLATLHANNANQALERILNFFPEERHPQILLQLSLNLRAIISQRLIATPDGRRVAAVEILIATPRVKDLIYKNEVGLLKEAMAQGSQDGMQTFDQHIFILYKEGRISYENAIAYADSANDVRLRIKIDKVGAADKKEAFEDKDLKLKPDIKTF
jgi:twitching motility protein PilU